MVAGVVETEDRRHAGRVPLEQTPWLRKAIIRPGHEVHLLNLSAGGALVESGARLKPGLRTELHLSGPGRRTIVGRIDRCHVAALDPIRYQGAIVFDQHQQW